MLSISIVYKKTLSFLSNFLYVTSRWHQASMKKACFDKKNQFLQRFFYFFYQNPGRPLGAWKANLSLFLGYDYYFGLWLFCLPFFTTFYHFLDEKDLWFSSLNTTLAFPQCQWFFSFNWWSWISIDSQKMFLQFFCNQFHLVFL